MGGTLTERIKNGRVDFVGIGDSNQLLSGHGWDHGMQYALYSQFPMYATELMGAFENDWNGIGRGYLYAWARAMYESRANTPQELTDWSLYNLNYCAPGYFPAGFTTDYGGIIATGTPVVPIGIEEELRFDAHYLSTGLSSVGKFKLSARIEGSPFTLLAESPEYFLSNFDEIGVSHRTASLDIPAGSRAAIGCRVGKIGAPTSIAGPFCVTWNRLLNKSRVAGVSYHTLLGLGSHSLLAMHNKLETVTDKALTHFFDIIRNDQGDTKTVVMVVNGGLNDRNETDPSALNGYLPGDGGPAFADNLAAIVARIDHIWTINGWSKEELHWMFMVSHPVSEPDSSELIAYRAALESYAADMLRCQVIDLSELTNYTEMAANDWYLTVSDQNHLKQAGYENLSERIVSAIDLKAGNSLMWGPYANCDTSLPTDGQVFKSHALPIAAKKLTVFPGVATNAQINEAKE